MARQADQVVVALGGILGRVVTVLQDKAILAEPEQLEDQDMLEAVVVAQLVPAATQLGVLVAQVVAVILGHIMAQLMLLAALAVFILAVAAQAVAALLLDLEQHKAVLFIILAVIILVAQVEIIPEAVAVARGILDQHPETVAQVDLV